MYTLAPSIDKFIRDFYRGGRVEIFHMGRVPRDRLYYLDFTSLYPWAGTKSLPYGESVWVEKVDPKNFYGFVSVEVKSRPGMVGKKPLHGLMVDGKFQFGHYKEFISMNLFSEELKLTNMYSVLVPQSWSQKQSVTSAKYLAKAYDPYSFYGGRKALSASGAFTDATDYVNKYVWKYGSTYYPQAPIELVPDSTLALETSLATLDLKNNERPFMATLEDNATDSQPRFETRDFVLAHSFRKSGDKGIVSGLNSANSGAPISLQLHFNSNPNASVPKSVQTFIE